ncbi:HAD family hydrolase [bacterium]|nr:HAD family hydrolase [bacterium]
MSDPASAQGRAMKRKALFLDRDGVINKDFGYVYEVERLEYVDGIFELCRKAKSKGYLIIVITNQAGIGRGYYSEQQFLDFMDIIKAKFIEEDCQIDAVYYCPHHPEFAKGKYLTSCNCRKPNPGMFITCINSMNVDPDKSIAIGDKLSDIQAAKMAHIKFCYQLQPKDSSFSYSDYSVISNLIEAIQLIEDLGNKIAQCLTLKT